MLSVAPSYHTDREPNYSVWGFLWLPIPRSSTNLQSSLSSHPVIWHHIRCVTDTVVKCTCLLYLLNAYSRVTEKLTSFQLVKKFLAFYGIRKFITVFTSACHLSLSRARSIQSIPPNPCSWRSILILSFHLRLVLPSGFFTSGYLTTTLYTLLLSPIRATCPTNLILLDFITRTILGEEYRSFSSK